MIDELFKKSVLENQEMILELLTSADLNSELKKIILNQKKIVVELELRIKQLDEDLTDLKDENNDISEELNLIKNENSTLIKKSKARKETFSIGNSNFVNTSKDIFDNNLNIDNLIENKEFSLKLLQAEKTKKSRILKIFKIFIYTLAYERHEDNLEDFLTFLDIKESQRDKSIEDLAHREWIRSMDFNNSLLDLVEKLERIPQKNRYYNIVAKFESLIS